MLKEERIRFICDSAEPHLDARCATFGKSPVSGREEASR